MPIHILDFGGLQSNVMLREESLAEYGPPYTPLLHDLVQNPSRVPSMGDGPHIEGHQRAIHIHCVHWAGLEQIGRKVAMRIGAFCQFWESIEQYEGKGLTLPLTSKVQWKGASG